MQTHELTANPAGGYVAPDLVRLDPVGGGELHFTCLKDGCNFHRTFGTLGGAKRYIGEHMQLMHRVRVFWMEPA